MTDIHHLPTILVEELPTDSYTELESRTNEGFSPKPQPRLPDWVNWIRCVWDFLCSFFTYWNLLDDVPPDLLYHTWNAMPHHSGSIGEVHGEVKDDNEHPIGQLAVHPKLCLLAVAVGCSTQIRLYETTSSVERCRFEAVPSKAVSHSQRQGNPVITCLQFSSGDILAVGLSDGTVHLIQQKLKAMVLGTMRYSTDYRPDIQVVKLLPKHSLDINAKFLGPVTNLVFSPTSISKTSVSEWLAITTEKSGVWLWNQISKQALRAIRTGGVNQGCLAWVCLAREPEPEKKPIFSKLPPASTSTINLTKSTAQRWENSFGDLQDVFKLNEYFDSASPKQALPQAEQPAEKINDTKTFDGQSVLVVGTKRGQVRVHKLWQSSTDTKIEGFVDFFPHPYTHTVPFLPSRSTVAGFEISHLIVRRLVLTKEFVTLPLLVAYVGEASSELHAFHIQLLYQESARPLAKQAYHWAKEILRQLVNLTFLVTRTDREWLPSLSTSSGSASLPAVASRGGHSVRLDNSSSHGHVSVISLSALRSSRQECLLATVRPALSELSGQPQRDSCVLLDPSDLEVSESIMTPLVGINPLVLTPFRPVPFAALPPSGGYYTRMMAMLDHPIGHHQAPYVRVPTKLVVEHNYKCGQTRWGRRFDDRVQGAFLYQPASLLDPGVGVAVFEMEVPAKERLQSHM